MQLFGFSDQDKRRKMLDFSSITSLKAAEDACRDGRLMKMLLLPAELGGQDLPENVLYVPPVACEMKNESTAELLDAVRGGMREVAVVPEYRGTSFVPTKITITAAQSGVPHQYKLEIRIW
jgi:hypothetical protein